MVCYFLFARRALDTGVVTIGENPACWQIIGKQISWPESFAGRVSLPGLYRIAIETVNENDTTVKWRRTVSI